MGYSPFGGFNAMFSFGAIFMTLVPVLMFGIIIYRLVQSAKQSNKNNNSPVLTVDATVVTKRADVRHYHNNIGNNTRRSSSTTSYFATFEVASGDRMELQMSDTEYGLLVEHDMGKLTFQGTRYLGFERMRVKEI